MTPYFHRLVRIARPTSASDIWINASSGRSVASPRFSGSQEWPCMISGTGKPAVSSSVGGKSIRLTMSDCSPQPVKGPPQRAQGTRMLASWRLRL